MNNNSKIQHYVPQFLLKYFSVRKKSQIYVYDKWKSKSFLSHVKNLTSENGFYDFEYKGVKLTFENSLSELESNAKKIFDKIVKEESLSNLSNDEIEECSNFLAIQFIRTKRYRDTIEDTNSQLISTIEKRGWKISEDSNIKLLNKDEIKEINLLSLLDAHELSKHFLNKHWFVLKTSKKHPFFISDNPIVLQNQIDHSPRGSIGLAVKGIEIYFPISNTLCLSFLCKSWKEKFSEALEKQRLHEDNPLFKSETLEIDTKYFEDYLDAIETGSPREFKSENVENVNSLQVINSSRFVFSGYEDFRIVETMLAEDESFKHPPKVTIA